MATNWVDEVLSGATTTASKSLTLATGNALSVSNTSSEDLFTVTSDTTNGGYTSILGIEGQEAVLFLGADNADDAGDAWEIHADTSGNFKIGNRTSGTGAPTRGNTFTNALTIDSSRNITVGASDTGYDVKFWGDTANNYMLWDTSEDRLELVTTHNSSALKIISNATRSTDDAPDISILKNTAPNDGDYLGSVKFKSLDAGDSTVRTYSEIDTFVRDADDNTADGSMIFSILSHGAVTQALKVRSTNNGGTAVTQTQVTNGALILDTVTFTANDTTPRVDGGNIFITGANTGSTAITQLENGAAGQIVILTCNSSGTTPTIADGGNFVLSAAWEPGVTDTLTLFTTNGTTWREIARTNN